MRVLCGTRGSGLDGEHWRRDIPPMKATVDSKRRTRLPRNFQPGDVVDLEMHGDDTVIVRLLKPVARPNLRLVNDGASWVFVGGSCIGDEDVRRLLDDDPMS